MSAGHEATSGDYHSRVTGALIKGDFNIAHDIIIEKGGGLIHGLWEPMSQRLMSHEQGSTEWGNAVLDTIIAADPDYFSQYSTRTDAAVDLFHGEQVGVIAGLLGREDVIDMLVNPQMGLNIAPNTAAGIAFGLGFQDNREGFLHLINQIPQYSIDCSKAIIDSFDAGLQEATQSCVQ